MTAFAKPQCDPICAIASLNFSPCRIVSGPGCWMSTTVVAGDDWTSVLLGGSGTTALEAMLSSLLPRDARLLVMENGVYGERISRIAEIHGIEFQAVEHHWMEAIDFDRVENCWPAAVYPPGSRAP